MQKKVAPLTPEFRAEARFQRTSPQKAKLVLDLIKGLRVEAAINTVAFTHKRIAPVVEKVLRSAVQNAQYLSDEKGLDIDVDNLYVKTAVANEGPRMKRIRLPRWVVRSATSAASPTSSSPWPRRRLQRPLKRRRQRPQHPPPRARPPARRRLPRSPQQRRPRPRRRWPPSKFWLSVLSGLFSAQSDLRTGNG